MWPLLLVLFGPPLVVIWVAGLRALWRDAEAAVLRPGLRAAAGVHLRRSGAQPHYPVFLLPVPFAAGMVAMERHLGRVWGGLFAFNGAVSLVLGPADASRSAPWAAPPVPGINLLAQDSIGWPAYVRQVTEVYDALPDRAHAAVFTSNYGEAGAITTSGPTYRSTARRTRSTTRLVPRRASPPWWSSGASTPRCGGCSAGARFVPRLDNGVGVDNEEQGLPIAVCTGPTAPWSRLWPRLQHLD